MTRPRRTNKARLVTAFAGIVLLAPFPSRTFAQVQQIVQKAVDAELAANTNDKSTWTYRDHDVTPGSDALTQTVETPEGTVKRTLVYNGQPLIGAERDKESDRIAQFAHDSSAFAKQRKNAAHDDAQAVELLHMLPTAFLWTVRSETPELITLEFQPNPGFSPPDMQSRVLAAMTGEMVVARDGNRIRTLRGTLSYDVKIGLGLLGKLNQGGTFQVERRQVAPGRWQITETHVHIGGHALLFKTIGQQEDDVKTDFKPSPARNPQEAEEYLRAIK